MYLFCQAVFVFVLSLYLLCTDAIDGSKKINKPVMWAFGKYLKKHDKTVPSQSKTCFYKLETVDKNL